MEELCKAFSQAKNQPTAIIAKTFKGRGISGPYARVSLPPPLGGGGPVADGAGGGSPEKGAFLHDRVSGEAVVVSAPWLGLGGRHG